jgi:uncharacterized membrane protein
MEALVENISGWLALIIEMVAVLMVAYGAGDAFVRSVGHVTRGGAPGWRRSVWRGFGMWLVLGLEFALAADIVRSVIAPTWDDIGQLAAIAAVRTGLNYFLAKDLEGEASVTTPVIGSG